MISAVVLAAGLSSRMGDFKPLMDLNGFPVAQMTIDSLKSGGVDEICVVLGKRADEVEAALFQSSVRFVTNERYAETDMLHSVKLGLAQVSGSDAAFIIPADIPLTAPETITSLKKSLAPDVCVCLPCTGGKAAHPPLISASCFDFILGYDGGGGLAGALRQFANSTVRVEVGDEGALMDADTPEDYERLRARARRTKGISRELCRALMDEHALEPKIRRHCECVARLALSMAGALIKTGLGLDLRLVESSALLHDLCRTQPKHAEAGAAALAATGYDAIAEIVRGHMRLGDSFVPVPDEATVVFLADKTIKGDRFITIDERYEASLLKCPEDEEARERIKRELARVHELKSLYEKVTNSDLYEQCRDLLSQA